MAALAAGGPGTLQRPGRGRRSAGDGSTRRRVELYLPLEACGGRCSWSWMRVERERRLFNPAAVWPGEEESNGTAGHDDVLELVLRSLQALAATDRGVRRIGSHGALVQVRCVARLGIA